MDFLREALEILRESNIEATLVGEISQNYYNVPCVLHEINICIPEPFFTRACELFVKSHQFEAQRKIVDPIYNEFQDASAFLHTSRPDIPIVLVSDMGCGGKLTVIDASKHDGSPVYSDQMSYVSRTTIPSLPLPTLETYVSFLCAIATKDERALMPKIRLEQLVDGMNIDVPWYQKHLGGCPGNETVKILIEGKHDRIDELTGTNMCIQNKMSTESLRQIPGYSM